MKSTKQFLVRALRSRRTTMTLLALIIGMNTAYVMRSDSEYARTFMLTMIALAALALIMCAWVETRGESPRRSHGGHNGDINSRTQRSVSRRPCP